MINKILCINLCKVLFIIQFEYLRLIITLLIPEAISMTMGQKVKLLRKRLGLTQKEVASMLGISQSYISRIEKKVIKKLRNTMIV